MYYIFLTIITSLSIFLIGHICVSFLNFEETDKSTVFFAKITVGLILLVTFFASIHSNFHTQLIGIWALLIIVIYFLKTQEKIDFKTFYGRFRVIDFREILIFLFYAVFVSSLFVFFYGISGENLNEIHPDHPFYSQISVSLYETGQENLNFTESYYGLDTTSLYHYFELWFTALLYPFGNSTALNALEFVCYPVLSAISLFGGYVLIHGYYKNTNRFVIIAFPLILLFISSLPPFQLTTDYSPTLGNLGIKLSIVYICISWVLINYKNSKFSLIFPLSLCSILYVTTLPVITGAVFVIFIIDIFKSKKVDWLLLLLCLIPSVSIALFYFVTAGNITASLSIVSLLFNRIETMPIINFIKIIIGNILQMSFSKLTPFIPFALLFIPVRKSFISRYFNLRILLLLGLIILFSFINFGVLYGIQDSSQFISNILYPILNIVSFLIIYVAFSQKNIFVKSFSIALMLYSFYNNQAYFFKQGKSFAIKPLDYQYNNDVIAEFSNKSFRLGIMNNSQFYSQNIFSKNIDCTIPFSNLRRFTNSYMPICLSVHEVTFNSDEERIYAERRIVNSPFYRYVVEHDMENNLDTAKLNFIKQSKFDYLLIENGNMFYSYSSSLPITKEIELQDYRLLQLHWD